MRFLLLSGVLFGASLIVPRALYAQGGPCPEFAPGEFTILSDECEYDFPPWVWISPAPATYEGWELPHDSLQITITWCDDKGLTASSRVISLNGTNVTSQFDFTTESALGNCPIRRESRGKVKLALGTNTLVASIKDNAQQLGAASAGYTFGSIGVAIGPKNRTIRVRASLATGETFAVRNTSTGPVNFTLTRTCTTPATSCTGPTSTGTLAAGATYNATINFTAASSGSNGTVKLKATYSSGGTVLANDSATVTVSVANQGAPTLSVAEDNPGTRLARQHCLAIGLGSGAAAECGDLRIAHPLPSTATMGLARTPTLIYNSGHVTPTVTVQARVSMPSVARPDTVKAVLTLNGVQHTRKWNGRDWGSNAAQRITVAIPDLTLATGVYPFTLEVENRYGATSYAAGTTSGQVVVINRTASAFGSGWWLSGLEELRFQAGDSILWVGGDGSVRVYAKVGTDRWLAPSLDRVDSLTKVGSNYIRHLPNKLRTVFNLTGEHIATVNRLNDTTTFAYSSGRLTTIVIPVTDKMAIPSTSASRRYVFTYTSNRLTKVAAPPSPQGARETTISRALGGDRITAIKDPDLDSTVFSYAGSTARIRRRTDRRGTAHAYGYDIAHKIAADTLFMQTGSNIMKSYVAAESRGAANSSTLRTSVHIDSAFARLDGPRTDVADLATFWVNGLGSVTRIRNALGDTTRISYGNSTFPMLATRVRQHSGVVDTVVYNARGLVSTATTQNALGPGTSATTTYTWHAVWDMPTKVVGPLGDSTRVEFAYSDTTGNRNWQSDSRGDTSKVHFRYYPTGLLRAVQYPRPPADASQYAMIRDTLAYDSRGNVRFTIDPEGDTTWTYRDVLGRDSVAVSPIAGSHRARRRSSYNIMNWLTQTIDSVPSMTYSLRSFTEDPTSVPALWHQVNYTYDKMGNQTHIQSFVPDLSDVRTDVTHTYDRANRLVARTEGSGPRTITYDPAGNVISTVGANGKTVTQQYDPMNRVIRTVSEAVTYSQESCARHPTGPIGGAGCQMRFPYYPNNGTGLLVSGDTALFAYDSTGQMIRADSRYAKVRRTYFPGGLIKADTLRIGSYSSPQIATHTLGFQFTYDALGRRATHVSDLGTTSYTYHRFGALRRITDPQGTRYDWTYDGLTRIDTFKVSPSGSTAKVREYRRYYADGSSRWRKRETDALGEVLADSLEYDKRGKVLEAFRSSLVQYGDEWVSVRYDGLGAVVAHERTSTTSTGFDVEQFENDAFGNVRWTQNRNASGGALHAFHSDFSIVGELMTRDSELLEPLETAQGAFRETMTQQHLGAGLISTSRTRDEYSTDGVTGVWNWSSQVGERHYYDGNSRLAAVQKYDWSSSGTSGTWEEYRYDALGRRILTRTMREPDNAPSGSIGLCTVTTGACMSYIERVAWDGAQVAWESRQALGASDASNSGTIYYIHGPGLDIPVGVRRDGTTRILNYNWRGLAESSVLPNGNAGDCAIGNCAITVAWPSTTGAYFTRYHASASLPGVKTWLGSLPANGEGSTGMLYRRNRYYDPGTGRFTQEDPIGLAGGLNLYGFADGDPVNFSDPFGLSPCWAWSQPDSEACLAARNNLQSCIAGGPCERVELTLPGIGPGGRRLFTGARAALRHVLRTSRIEGVSGWQGLSILGRLSKGRVDQVSISAGERGNVVASFTKLLDKGKEVTIRTYDSAGKEISTVRQVFDEAGKLVREGVMR